MPSDETTLTLALVLTGGGVVVASAFITGFVQLLKQVVGGILDGRERVTAFFLSGVLVVLAVAAGISEGSLTLTLPSGFAAFLAWYGIARLSVANWADVSREPNSLRGEEIK